MFLKVLPRTGSLHFSVLAFIAFCAVLYASAGASLSIVSKMFTLVWLFVMMLFPLSLLLLKFNRGRLPRARRTSLWLVFGAFAVALVVIGGNIAIDPTTAMSVPFVKLPIYCHLFLSVQILPHLLLGGSRLVLGNSKQNSPASLVLLGLGPEPYLA
jgi:hypothetical protein